MKTLIRSSVLFFIFSAASSALAQTTFTYQGRMTDAGAAANGNYDLQFTLFDSVSGGTQIGATQTVSVVSVTGGVFTVQLDFGANAFSGANRWLEISARLSGAPAFTTLSPRQPITSTPYAIRTLSAAAADAATNATNAQTATNATQLGGVAASQYVQTNDPRLTDARQPVAGSSNYIQNTTARQANANFNISGNGTIGGDLNANFVSAQRGFSLGANTRFTALGTNNLMIGLNGNTNGIDNTHVGQLAGFASLTGDANSFFGVSAGFNNQGTANSFFGRSAGFQNTAGINNSFFGVQAGRDNTTGKQNSFFGWQAGIGNQGDSNSFFGARAGANNRGGNNSFFGDSAGVNNTTGDFNNFFGDGAGLFNTTGRTNNFFGSGAGAINSTGGGNSFFGDRAGNNNTGGNNSFFGSGAGGSNTTGNNNIAIGSSANVGAGDLEFATAIGAAAVVTASNRVQIGRTTLDTVAIGAFASPATATAVCINGQGVFTSCAASSLRYKQSVRSFQRGLSVIQRLRPVTFKWKEDHQVDFGLVAEEVAAVEPLLSTYNNKGEIDGVKYERLNVLLINAVKEQQAQIESLRALNTTLQSRLGTVESQLKRRTARFRRRASPR